MKISVLLIGTICIVLSILFIGYGVKSGLIEKKILTNHYTKVVTGRKAVSTGIVYIAIGMFFLAGAIVVLVSLYLKISHGKM